MLPLVMQGAVAQVSVGYRGLREGRRDHPVRLMQLHVLVGGVPVLIDTCPDFRIDLNQVADAITDKTKLISKGQATSALEQLAS